MTSSSSSVKSITTAGLDTMEPLLRIWSMGRRLRRSMVPVGAAAGARGRVVSGCGCRRGEFGAMLPLPLAGGGDGVDMAGEGDEAVPGLSRGRAGELDTATSGRGKRRSGPLDPGLAGRSCSSKSLMSESTCSASIPSKGAHKTTREGGGKKNPDIENQRVRRHQSHPTHLTRHSGGEEISTCGKGGHEQCLASAGKAADIAS